MADTHAKKHDYHLVDPSPWPVVGATSAFILAVGVIMTMHKKPMGGWLLALGALMVAFTMYVWWRDVVREARAGLYTPVVQIHHRYGMILFIASEVMFFVAWFWGWFDNALFPADVHQPSNVGTLLGQTDRNTLYGGHWPPKPNDKFQGTFDPWGLPLVNTLILLLSGTTVTWAHHALLKNDRKGLVWGLAVTVVLGVLFTVCQAYEYLHAPFKYAGFAYGSTFFMATGFHGAHVIIGTIFLFVCLMRALKGDFTPKQHFGFEAAAWYWHFVDVVWLFLFSCIYVWFAAPAPGH